MSLVKKILLNSIGVILISVTGLLVVLTLMYFGYLKVGGKGLFNR